MNRKEMFREIKETLLVWGIWFGLIAVICAISISIAFGVKACDNYFAERCYYVEETGYFHSTKDVGECNFVGQAIERGYKLEEIICDSAKSRRYKMCKLCYSKKEQDTYKRHLELEEELDNIMASHEREIDEMKKHNYYLNYGDWSFLTKGKVKNVDPEKLIVYFSEGGVLHIIETTDTEYKIRLSDVQRFSELCKHCVPTGLREFIYKKVYQGYYDMSVIEYEEDSDDYY